MGRQRRKNGVAVGIIPWHRGNRRMQASEHPEMTVAMLLVPRRVLQQLPLWLLPLLCYPAQVLLLLLRMAAAA